MLTPQNFIMESVSVMLNNSLIDGNAAVTIHQPSSQCYILLKDVTDIAFCFYFIDSHYILLNVRCLLPFFEYNFFSYFLTSVCLFVYQSHMLAFFVIPLFILQNLSQAEIIE